MRARRLVVALGSIALLSAGGVALAKGGNSAPPPAAPLVVHEWGTFTSVQGTKGIVLEGLHHEEEPLPAFVYSRAKVRDCPLRAYGWKGLETQPTHVTQKMETPVIYFHGGVGTRRRVRVDFVKGLLTQWYPVSDLLGPPEGKPDQGPLDVAKVERSYLEWEVDLLDGSAGAPAEMPSVAKDDPWSFARKVDAAWVNTTPRKGPDRKGPVEADRFLFYRGLGAFDLPFRAEVDEKGAVAFHDQSGEAVAEAIALEVGTGAKEGRFRLHTGIAAKSDVADMLHGVAMEPWAGAGVERLKDVVRKVLVAHGMFDDEAAAMVATWSRSWFQSEGVRVIYLVPRPLVDALLPLAIDPAPARIERALVGRIECVRPEMTTALESAIRERRAPDGDVREHGQKTLESLMERLGRFVEPNLRMLAQTTKDKEVREDAEILLPPAWKDEPR